MTLTRESFLQMHGRPARTQAVSVPGMGTVHVRVMTARERDSFEAEVVGGADGKHNLANLRGRLMALLCCDESGKRLFDDDDAGMLGDLPADVVEAVLTPARLLNGLSVESVEKAKGN